MTKKPRSGTLSTRTNADKKAEDKNPDVLGEVSRLVGTNKVRILGHANERMA